MFLGVYVSFYLPHVGSIQNGLLSASCPSNNKRQALRRMFSTPLRLRTANSLLSATRDWSSTHRIPEVAAVSQFDAACHLLKDDAAWSRGMRGATGGPRASQRCARTLPDAFCFGRFPLRSLQCETAGEPHIVELADRMNSEQIPFLLYL